MLSGAAEYVDLVQDQLEARKVVVCLLKTSRSDAHGLGLLPTHLGQVLHSHEIPDNEFEQCKFHVLWGFILLTRTSSPAK
jgi:hypothetical protein